MEGKTVKQSTVGQERIFNLLLKPMSALNIWLFRLSGGKLGGRFMGAPVLLLTTRGRKTGQLRTVPLLYLQDGEAIVLVASKGGMPHHPLWYKNLEVNPDVEVEVGGEKKAMSARRATDEEKKALWPKLVALYRSYETYQARTERNIPVMILSPC
jgi:F420H(2)-dependent quinone reductase